MQKAIDAYFAECELEQDSRVFKHGKTFEWTDADTKKVETRCKDCRRLVFDEFGLPTTGCRLIKGRLKERIPATITGLAIALGCDKETIKTYSEKDEFSRPLKAAYLKVQNALEVKLHSDQGQPAKIIFGLTNFDGWKNPQHIDHTSGGDKIQGGFISVPVKKPEGAE